jgi:hypothetical protein
MRVLGVPIGAERYEVCSGLLRINMGYNPDDLGQGPTAAPHWGCRGHRTDRSCCPIPILRTSQDSTLLDAAGLSQAITSR